MIKRGNCLKGEMVLVGVTRGEGCCGVGDQKGELFERGNCVGRCN